MHSYNTKSMQSIATRFPSHFTNIPHEIWGLSSKIDQLKGRWIEGAHLHPQILGSLKQSVLITSTGASTRIEGARMADSDIEKLMRGIAIQKFRDRDVAEVKGYYELLSQVFDHWKTMQFNESTVKHFHKELLKYVEKDTLHRGEYKHRENKVHMINAQGESLGVLFDTAPVYLTPIMMQELVEATKDLLKENTYHPLLIIGNFIVEFLAIHPFTDGNGRLSRILTNLLLLQAGYTYVPYVSHEKLIEDNKPDYYMALRKSQNTFTAKNSSTLPWLTFFLTVFLKQSETAVGLLSQETVEHVLSKKQLSVWNYLQTVPEAAPLEITQHTNIARRTINQALDKLLRLQKIERIGSGSSIRYRKRI